MTLLDPSKRYRILSLDGGGAKGFYTLGVLKQIEAMLGGGPLSEQFDLIFGTSTGAIIAALLGLGRGVTEIHELYKQAVPPLMRTAGSGARSASLERLATDVFRDLKFDAMKTRISIVAARWLEEKPMIFKPDSAQAHGMKESFIPGFGCTIAEAVVASCSAYPLFNLKVVHTLDGPVKVLDGGYCANNPTHLVCHCRCRESPRDETRSASRRQRRRRCLSGAAQVVARLADLRVLSESSSCTKLLASTHIRWSSSPSCSLTFYPNGTH